MQHATDGEPWFGFDAARQLPGLPEELLLIPLAGHTRGHTGVVIDTGGNDGPRWLVHAGDAYFFHGQLHRQPHCPPGLSAFQVLMQADKTARLQNLGRLRELALTRDDVHIICAHDPADLTNALSTPRD